jgi:hypothetical protein
VSLRNLLSPILSVLFLRIEGQYQEREINITPIVCENIYEFHDSTESLTHVYLKLSLVLNKTFSIKW